MAWAGCQALAKSMPSLKLEITLYPWGIKAV